uniref:Uncharacterized protein n=1 Tax=Meloidogyne floridensis TaxID=298350 RepID=A0A915NCT1_9BILA
VCICDESLCNTFAFLRSQIDGNYEEQQQQRLIASDYADSSALTRWKETAILRRDSNNNNIRIGENILDSNEENEPNSRRRWMERQQNKQQGGRGRGANLVLLLVVLPLVVGAFTV